MSEEWDPDDLTAVRLLLNIHYAIAHDSWEDVARKTGIELDRLEQIIGFVVRPDGYEIALIQHAYGLDIWPTEAPDTGNTTETGDLRGDGGP